MNIFTIEKKKGFTLMELMIVVGIITILMAIALPRYLNILSRSQISAVESDLKSIGKAMEMYYMDWGKYPETDSWDTVKAELTGTSGATVNKAGGHPMSGENAPMQYIQPPFFVHFEKEVGGASNISYSCSHPDSYTLTINYTVRLKHITFTLSQGGTIDVSYGG
jgi:type II secretion system protein G